MSVINHKYSAWIVSVGFHGILFVLLFKSRLPSHPQASMPIMKAYVVVNLSAQSHDMLIKKHPPVSHHDSNNEGLNSSSHAEVIKAPKNNKKEQVRSEPNISTGKIEPKKAQVENARKQLEISKQVSLQQENDTKFKSLDPYAKLPIKLRDDKAKQRQFSFDYSTSQGAEQMAEYNRITVPTAHSNKEQSEIIATTEGGSKRLEKWRGKCYDVDLTTVFGRSGMPQGRPRLCPGEKSDDQILLEKSLEKWERVSRTK